MNVRLAALCAALLAAVAASVAVEIPQLVQIAGNGVWGTFNVAGDGPHDTANLKNPYGVAVDPVNGGLVVTERDQAHSVIRVSNTGVVATRAGMSGSAGSSDGFGTAAGFTFPTGVAVDAAGNALVADE